jgi:hypothetical protein
MKYIVKEGREVFEFSTMGERLRWQTDVGETDRMIKAMGDRCPSSQILSVVTKLMKIAEMYGGNMPNRHFRALGYLSETIIPALSKAAETTKEERERHLREVREKKKRRVETTAPDGPKKKGCISVEVVFLADSDTEEE